LVLVRFTPVEARRLIDYLERSRLHLMHMNDIDAQMHARLTKEIRSAMQTFEESKRGRER